MKIETFTENDIREAAELAYPVWGVGYADSGRGKDFGLLMCEYIVRYGFDGVAAFKSDEWKTDADEYLTYIYKKDIG